jgi:ATP-binding cassette, subfamily B, multidrug efflux pump
VTLGCVRVDGVDVRIIDQKALRGIIAVVPQKMVLFSGSILENIKWGREDADDAAISYICEVPSKYYHI